MRYTYTHLEDFNPVPHAGRRKQHKAPSRQFSGHWMDVHAVCPFPQRRAANRCPAPSHWTEAVVPAAIAKPIFFFNPLTKKIFFLPFYPPSPFLQLQCQGGAMPVPTDPTLRPLGRPLGRPLDDIQRFWLAGITGCGWRGWKLRNSRGAATIHGGQARRIGSNAVIAANCSARRLLLGRRANSCLYLRYLGYLMYSDSYQFRSGLRLNSQSW